jgi:hypothetical protein
MAVGKKAKIKGPIKGDMNTHRPFKASLDSRTSLYPWKAAKAVLRTRR